MTRKRVERTEAGESFVPSWGSWSDWLVPWSFGPELDFYAMHPGWADTPGVETSLPRAGRVMRPQSLALTQRSPVNMNPSTR